VLRARGRRGVDGVAGSGTAQGRRRRGLGEDNNIAGSGMAQGQWRHGLEMAAHTRRGGTT
jgi:hypothetical protein